MFGKQNCGPGVFLEQDQTLYREPQASYRKFSGLFVPPFEKGRIPGNEIRDKRERNEEIKNRITEIKSGVHTRVK